MNYVRHNLPMVWTVCLNYLGQVSFYSSAQNNQSYHVILCLGQFQALPSLRQVTQGHTWRNWSNSRPLGKCFGQIPYSVWILEKQFLVRISLICWIFATSQLLSNPSNLEQFMWANPPGMIFGQIHGAVWGRGVGKAWDIIFNVWISFLFSCWRIPDWYLTKF